MMNLCFLICSLLDQFSHNQFIILFFQFDVVSSFYLAMINSQAHSVCAILYSKYILLSNVFHHVTCVLPKPWMLLAHEQKRLKTLKNCWCTYQKKLGLYCAKLQLFEGPKKKLTHLPFPPINPTNQKRRASSASSLASDSAFRATCFPSSAICRGFRQKRSAHFSRPKATTTSKATHSLPLDRRNSLSPSRICSSHKGKRRLGAEDSISPAVG
jgi:hypothetical protein